MTTPNGLACPFRRLTLVGATIIALISTAPARAAEDVDAKLQRIEALLVDQSARLAAQERKLSEQAALIQQQQNELRALRDGREDNLAELRAGRAAAPQQQPGALGPPAGPPPRTTAQLPSGPVGEAPAPTTTEQKAREVAAIPERLGVLTPKGRFVVDPAIEYVRTGANRLTFRGVEVVPGINLGLIEAGDADRDAVIGSVSARYGLTDRIEVEARVPYVYRHDRVTTVAAADQAVVRTLELDANDIGDIEVSGRYQINSGKGGWPIFVAGLRVKSDTGVGPYDVEFDRFAVAKELSTGSGFWASELGVTMLYPSDPAVIYGGVSYLHSFGKDVNKQIGDNILVGNVDPGDGLSASIGFGLALNPKFSVSFGYSHHYIFPTDTEINGTTQSSNSLSIGALQMGLSYRLNQRFTLINSFEFGVTSDAPDMRLTLRVPYTF
ncbi:transporter [Phenylobacterium sp.]|uniref:transporter n=1 Tax=Phenylobacterium sp. TaxID=1871053 RepID=UPI0028A061CD|nr:transporter [Phenylobacterium sp.]